MWLPAAVSEVSGATGSQSTKSSTMSFSAVSSRCTDGRVLKLLGAGWVVGFEFVAVRLFHASRTIDGEDLFASAGNDPTVAEGRTWAHYALVYPILRLSESPSRVYQTVPLSMVNPEVTLEVTLDVPIKSCNL